MRTKLTLSIDGELIAKAKHWAKSRDMTLSDAVANFFTAMSARDPEPLLNERTRRLIGIARHPGERAPNDEEAQKEYMDYLERKYR